MYLRKPKSCVLLAVVYYAVVLAGMYAIARLQYRGVRWYPLLYLLLAGLPTVWVLFREKDLASVGIPQLVFAFVFHICMCRVADRRQSIWQCVAIHFAVDYVQRIV